MIEWKRLPSNAELLTYAKDEDQRRKGCRGDIRDGYENPFEKNFAGKLCERMAAYLTGGDMNLEKLRGGDGGIDLTVDVIGHGKRPVDCKAARKPTWLAVPVEECKSGTIYILGKLLNWDDGTGKSNRDYMNWDVELLRWNTGATLMRDGEQRVLKAGYPLNWCILQEDNREIDVLLAKINRQWGRGA